MVLSSKEISVASLHQLLFPNRSKIKLIKTHCGSDFDGWHQEWLVK